MKQRWMRVLAPVLLVAVVALGACSPPESGGGDGGAPANGADDGY
jgi:hypothetical protein